MTQSGHDSAGSPYAATAPAPRTVVPAPPGQGLAVGGMPALIHSVHLMSRAIDHIRHELSERLELNPVDVTALIHVYNYPDIRPTDLGRALNMGSAGLTSLADRLVRAGYLQRSSDPTDRRGNRLKLSPAGLHAAGWVFDCVAGALTTHLPPGCDAGAMAEVMAEVSQALDRADPADAAAVPH